MTLQLTEILKGLPIPVYYDGKTDWGDVIDAGYIKFAEAEPITDKRLAFQNALVKTRYNLIAAEGEAAEELTMLMRRTQAEISARIAAMHAAVPEEEWTYNQLLVSGRYEDLNAAIEFEIERYNLEATNLTGRYGGYTFLRDVDNTAELLFAHGINAPTSTFIDMAVVDFFVNLPINGTVYGERFAALTASVQAKGRQALVSGLIAGDSPYKISKEFAKITNFNRTAAERITRTTLMNASNMAHAFVYEEAGVTIIIRLATLDAVTCAICAWLDGEEMSVREAQNISLHPNCR